MKPIAYAVYPCDQWHRENPHKRHETPYLWLFRNHAMESANDTGGKVIELFAAGTLEREVADLRDFIAGVANQMGRRVS